jgi:sugar O-acyltransferase (sialic acid O-acetyltransferase NeuD family)
MNKIPIFVFGTGGHAKVVIDTVRCANKFKLLFLIDDKQNVKNSRVLKCQCIGGRDELLAHRDQVNEGIVAIGNNFVRTEIADWLNNKSFDLATIIHPSAIIASDVNIEAGTLVMPSVVINPSVNIGRNVIINTNSIVEHDCQIDSGAHIAPGSILSGGVVIEKNVFVGAGSVILPGLRIGENAIVGANSTVLRDISPNETVVGSPARSLKKY